MRLWFAPSSDVPIYRQLATQVALAILCGDLRPGDRLPSTRELARRFALHPNTISAGYRQLEREGWTERRHGSGVYVRSAIEPAATPEQVLDRHIAAFFRAVRELDLPAAVVRARVAEWLAAPPPDHFLVIDPDAELRRILLTEITQCGSLPAREASLEALAHAGTLSSAIPICRPSKTRLVRAALPMGVELLTLPIRSANEWLAPWLPASGNDLLAVVSRWPDFLDIARTMLIAAGFSADALLFRDVRRPRWHSGLDQATAILCDAFTATLPTLPRGPRTIIFPLLADEARLELGRYSHTGSAL
jgi:GntR family transcriptional regulator